MVLLREQIGESMNMQQCTGGGHFYDASIHKECPYCNNNNVNPSMPPGMGRTMPLVGGNADIGKTMPLMQNGDGDSRKPAQSGANGAGRTVAIVKEELGIDPVVGWLISLDL